MSVRTTMVTVVKYVPILHLGASRVHATLAMFSILMAVHVMVGHTYTSNNLT